MKTKAQKVYCNYSWSAAVEYVENYYIGRALSQADSFVRFKFLHRVGAKSLMMFTSLVCFMAPSPQRVLAHLLFQNSKTLKNCLKKLRASSCKYRKFGDSVKIFSFFIFCPNKAFSELFSKIQLKDPKALEFFQNRGKFENRHFGLPPPLKIDKNDAFSFRSCW